MYNPYRRRDQSFRREQTVNELRHSHVMGIVGTRTDASRVGQAVVQKALGSHTWIESPRSSIDRELQELVDRLAKIVKEE